MKREDDGPNSINQIPNGTHQRESRSANEKPRHLPVAGLKSMRLVAAPEGGTANRAYTRSLQPPMTPGYQ